MRNLHYAAVDIVPVLFSHSKSNYLRRISMRCPSVLDVGSVFIEMIMGQTLRTVENENIMQSVVFNCLFYLYGDVLSGC